MYVLICITAFMTLLLCASIICTSVTYSKYVKESSKNELNAEMLKSTYSSYVLHLTSVVALFLIYVILFAILMTRI